MGDFLVDRGAQRQILNISKGGISVIYCVEDDASIRDIEVYALNSAGYEARGFAEGESFLKALKTEKPELVILDIMLPGVDGMELLKRIRNSTDCTDLPVILSTAKGEEYDKIRGLDSGADYYLTKPFGVLELISCVKAVLRRCSAAQKKEEILEIDGLKMNLTEHTVSLEGKEISLTYKEFEVLRLFLSHPGVVFSREQLMERVWGTDYYGETRTVDMHIRTLRQKLGAFGEKIKTVRSVGYRLEEHK